MARGSTKSAMSLRERREASAELFAQGNRVSDVAEELGVTWDTAKRYKDEYERRLQEQAERNPQLLREVVTNTFRSLEELDAIRRNAWKDYQEAVALQVRAQILGVLTRTQEQKAKLFGLLGVKPEVFVTINNVRIVQDRIISWMQSHLCDEDRDALESFLMNDLAPFLENRPPPIDVPLIEQEAS